MKKRHIFLNKICRTSEDAILWRVTHATHVTVTYANFSAARAREQRFDRENHMIEKPFSKNTALTVVF